MSEWPVIAVVGYLVGGPVCPECGRRQISGNDHFGSCSQATLREYATSDRYAMPTTGDPEKDRVILDRFAVSSARLEQNICANGCGPMVIEDPHNRTCPVCGFAYFRSDPIEVPPGAPALLHNRYAAPSDSITGGITLSGDQAAAEPVTEGYTLAKWVEK